MNPKALEHAAARAADRRLTIKLAKAIEVIEERIRWIDEKTDAGLHDGRRRRTATEHHELTDLRDAAAFLKWLNADLAAGKGPG